MDDLLHRESDIAVRILRPTQNALVARRVGGIEPGVHAHERYLAAHGTPKSMDELSRYALIGFDQENPYIRRLQNQFPMFSRAALAFSADRDLAQLGAIRAGLGIGVCQSALAARYKVLVRMLQGKFSLRMDTWIAMHEDLRESARCAAVFAALAAGLGAYIQRVDRLPAPTGGL
ncbi:DNA-binding transcriptional LysR family regulator [Paraburkholderia sp. JPY465]